MLGSCLQVTVASLHSCVCLYVSQPQQKLQGLRERLTQIAIQVRSAMLEHRQVLAHLSQKVEINSGKAEAWSLGAAGHHCTPGVHHHAVAITCSCLMVASTLCCRYYIALRFNGTGPQQHLRRRSVFTQAHTAINRQVTRSGHSRPIYSLTILQINQN